MRIWASVEEEEKLKCKDWATFIKLFQQAIDEIERRERHKKINKSIAIGVKELVKSDRAHRAVIKQAREGKRPQRLQALPSQTMETVVSDGSDDEDLPLSVNEEMPSPIADYDEDADSGEEPFLPEERGFDSELQQMAKAEGTCYEMANTGKCNRPNCQYSHKPEDIERLKKFRA
jgi:hypothetical protein